MTTTDLEQIEQPRPFRPQFIGQATAIEQARAVAEVQAAVTVAQAVPRRIDEAIRQAREACAQKTMAEQAFYRFSRAGQVVTGPSVHLARELKRCFGNLQSGIDELRRDDGAGESEVRAWAWDVQTNVREARILIVPHARDTKQGRRKLTELRDITEMIANIGSRAEREVILALLPAWYVELGVTACRVTNESGIDEKTRPVIVADLIASFDSRHGVTRDQLEGKLARPAGEWTSSDIASLRVVWRALVNEETTREQEFPQRRVTVAEITAAAPEQAGPSTPRPGPAPTVGETDPPTPGEDRPVTAVLPGPEPAGADESGDEAAPASTTQTAEVIRLVRRHRGTVGDLLSPLLGRQISRTSQLSAAEAAFVVGELQAQLDQADTVVDGPMFDDTPPEEGNPRRRNAPGNSAVPSQDAE